MPAEEGDDARSSKRRYMLWRPLAPHASVLRLGSAPRHGFSPFAPEILHSYAFPGAHSKDALLSLSIQTTYK
jgi:hypothetical protein